MKQSPFSILYAEDDNKIREKYTRFLKIYFKNVYEAIDGQESIELYEKHKPDIILLDINMPIINGLEVAKSIRELDKDTLLIILSAYSDKEKLLAATELMLTKYLIKPIQSSELENIVLKCIDNLETLKNKENLLYLDNDFIWNKNKETLSKENIIFKLTQKELLLLKLFSSKPNLTFSNIDILNYVWEDDFQSDFNTNKLRIVFSKLKTKLSCNLFCSIYNVGYKINLKRNI